MGTALSVLLTRLSLSLGVLMQVLAAGGGEPGLYTSAAQTAAGAQARAFYAIVTAYSSSVDETDDTPEIMASGRRVFDGAIACPRVYPFGTRFLISGRIYECLDRLSEKYDDRFDIWESSKRAALEFGAHYLEVEVIQ